MFLSDLGKARASFTNTLVIKSLTHSMILCETRRGSPVNNRPSNN